jgi:hypothetical protein
MKMPRDGQGKWLLLIPAGILLAMAAPSFLIRPSNCGGNSAALAVCKSYCLILSLTVSENSDAPVSVANLPAQYHDELARLARYHWVASARFLVSTALVTRETLSRPQVIIVCDTAYRNVPRRRFFKASPAHAVGYSDGTTALISPAEFNKLIKGSFVPLDTLYPALVPALQTLVIPEASAVEISAPTR